MLLIQPLLEKARAGEIELPKEGWIRNTNTSINPGLSPTSLLKNPTTFSAEMAVFLSKLWLEDKVTNHQIEIEQNNIVVIFILLMSLSFV